MKKTQKSAFRRGFSLAVGNRRRILEGIAAIEESTTFPGSFKSRKIDVFLDFPYFRSVKLSQISNLFRTRYGKYSQFANRKPFVVLKRKPEALMHVPEVLKDRRVQVGAAIVVLVAVAVVVYSRRKKNRPLAAVRNINEARPQNSAAASSTKQQTQDPAPAAAANGAGSNPLVAFAAAQGVTSSTDV